jgi:allantoinase
VLRGRRVVTAGLPNGLGPAAIHIRNGKIIALADYEAIPAGWPVVEAGARVLMPGLVETHAHINEPGRTDWKGFATGTRAAAGITTLVDMPLNCIPPTTARAHLEAKLRAAAGQLWCDVAFWGGIVPGNQAELRALIAAGVCDFKGFLVPSGVDEFPAVGEADLRAALEALAGIAMGQRLPILVHAEWPGPMAGAAGANANLSPRTYASWLAARPAAAETKAIELLVRLARELRGARFDSRAFDLDSK